MIRLATDSELATAASHLEDSAPWPHAYASEMLAHPIAGRSLRNYCRLTECPEIANSLGLSADEWFWSRYYWLARFKREWQAAVGRDVGIEQQVHQLLEHARVGLAPLWEVEQAVGRDAIL